MQRFPFICIEGVDGVGKTTVARRFAETFDFSYYKSPSGPLGAIRHVADESLSTIARFFFYRAATQYDSSMIEEILRNRPVIADRFIFSTLSYHMAMDPRILDFSVNRHLCQPDVTILLSAQKSEIARRLEARQQHYLDLDLDLLMRVSSNLKEMCRYEIDTTHLSVDAVVSEIASLIEKEGFQVEQELLQI